MADLVWDETEGQVQDRLRAQVARLKGELATSRAETKELAEKGYEASVWGWSKERNRIADEIFKVKAKNLEMAAAGERLFKTMSLDTYLEGEDSDYGEPALSERRAVQAFRAALSGEGKVREQVVEWCKAQKATNAKQVLGRYPSRVGDCPSCGYHGPVNDSGNVFRHHRLAAMKGAHDG